MHLHLLTLLLTLLTTLVSAGGYASTCDIPSAPFLTAPATTFIISTTCKTTAGKYIPATLDLAKCIANSGGQLVRRKNGGFSGSCRNTWINNGTKLYASCFKGSQTGPTASTEIDINAFVSNHNGKLVCDN